MTFSQISDIFSLTFSSRNDLTVFRVVFLLTVRIVFRFVFCQFLIFRQISVIFSLSVILKTISNKNWQFFGQFFWQSFRTVSSLIFYQFLIFRQILFFKLELKTISNRIWQFFGKLFWLNFRTVFSFVFCQFLIFRQILFL